MAGIVVCAFVLEFIALRHRTVAISADLAIIAAIAAITAVKEADGRTM